jgi:hypothetical protein
MPREYNYYELARTQTVSSYPQSIRNEAPLTDGPGRAASSTGHCRTFLQIIGGGAKRQLVTSPARYKYPCLGAPLDHSSIEIQHLLKPRVSLSLLLQQLEPWP